MATPSISLEIAKVHCHIGQIFDLVVLLDCERGAVWVAVCGAVRKAGEDVLVASSEYFHWVVQSIPREFFAGFDKMEDNFHRVAESSVVWLSSDESEFHTASVEVLEIPAIPVIIRCTGFGCFVSKVKCFAFSLVGEACYDTAIIGVVTTSFQEVASKVEVLVYEVNELHNGLLLGLVILTKHSDGHIAVHTAVSAS